MRIAQTTDGRYVKILSPQMKGVIGRLYKEINDRKQSDSAHDKQLGEHGNKIKLMSSQVDAMTIRYNEMTEVLRHLFPEDEPVAHIEKPLEVGGAVKAPTFVSTEEVNAPLTVASTALNVNLNAEFLNGKSLEDVSGEIDSKVNTLNVDVTKRLANAKMNADVDYAPKSHVNASGPGVHPIATYSREGFMSPVDKKKIDSITLPGGMIISDIAPSSPVIQQIWIDTN